jgi:hypothetical protein
MRSCDVATCETTSLYLSKWEFGGIWSLNDEGMCIDHVPPRDRGKPRKLEDIGSTADMCTRELWVRYHGTDQLCSGRPGGSWILHNSELSVHMINCICVHDGVQLKPKIQNTGTWLAAAWPPRSLCYYRQAVIFLHISLVTPSFSFRKNSARVSKTLSVYIS